MPIIAADTEPVSDSERREIVAAVVAMKLAREKDIGPIVRLSGGVSSDIYRVDVGGRPICVKRALPKLRVAADWRAPAERSATEVAWFKLAREIMPNSAPEVLGEDAPHHLFAMRYLPPRDYPVWKSLLATGHIETGFARNAGHWLATIHGATAFDEKVATHFANDTQFLALRLDPFFLFVAEKHETVATKLRALAQNVAQARIALMHGDVSPKNILCGPDGPVFLDAETACYGDPAFDVAFCLMHLLLKCVWHPKWQAEYLACFDSLWTGYSTHISWEAQRTFEERAAALIPALLLARVNGKSPAEYLTSEAQKALVRTQALALLTQGSLDLETIGQTWREAIARARL